MYCKHCGNKLKDDAKFCGQCGSSVSGDIVKKTDKVEIKSAENNISSSRMRRSTYVLSLLCSVVVLIFGAVLFPSGSAIIFGIIIYIIVAIWQFNISVRRVHDFGKSGWLTLLFFVPIANLILLGFCFFERGDNGRNKYGDSPIKKITA